MRWNNNTGRVSTVNTFGPIVLLLVQLINCVMLADQ